MIAGPHGGGPPPPAAVTTPLGTFRASDYGAKSVQEGSVDASGGINAAIAAASIQGGGKVSLDSGLEYDARRTVVLLANIELEIPTGTTLKAAAGLVGDLVVAQNAAGIRLSGGGTIDANRAGGATGNALTLTGCIEPQVEEVSIQNAYTDNLALVNCVRPVVDVLVGAAGRHGVYHSGTTFGRGQITARDNGQRVAGHGVVFDAASTDNSYGPLVSTDTRVGGAKSQQYGVFEVPASGCDRNTYAPSALGGNAVGTQSLVGASSGPVVIPPASITTGMIAPGAVGDAQVAAAAGILSTKLGGYPWRNADLATDVARANQAVNGGFEFNQRGLTTYGNNLFGLDRWATGAAGTAAFTSAGPDTTHPDIHSNQCLAVVVSATGADAVNFVSVQQKLEHYVALRGQPVSVSFRVQSVAAGSVRGFWFDGVTGGGAGTSQFTAAQATPAGGYTTYRFTFTPAANATSVLIGLTLDAVTTWYVDNCMVVPGSVAADYVPLPTADDLARCLRYYQRWQPNIAGSPYGVGQAESAASARIYIPLKAPVGGNPSFSISAAADFGVWSATLGANVCTGLVAPFNLNNGSVFALEPSVASGLVAGNAATMYSATANGWISVEWNP